MKRGHKYTMSEKRKLRDHKQTNWSRHMNIARMSKEGMTAKEIAKEYQISDKRVYAILAKSRESLPQ